MIWGRAMVCSLCQKNNRHCQRWVELAQAQPPAVPSVGGELPWLGPCLYSVLLRQPPPGTPNSRHFLASLEAPTQRF